MSEQFGPGRNGWSPRRRAGLAWGIADQILSSGTNFGLSVLAGRVLGTTGLGSVFFGFAYYLLVLGFQRVVLTEPLVASSSADDAAKRTSAVTAAVTISLLAGSAATALALAIGLSVGGVGRGILIFSPWLIPALLQDLWRVVLFRDGRGREAAANDLAWLVCMALTLPIAVHTRSQWIVVGTWGLGATVGAVFGLKQVRSSPSRLWESFRWWRRNAWPLGRWLAISGLVYSAGAYGSVFLLGIVVGAAELGGIRASLSVFAPVSVLGPALALPGLPALRKAWGRSPGDAWDLMLRLSGIAVLIAGIYTALVGMMTGILPLVFGPSFGRFRSLLWPIGVQQMALAATLSIGMLFKISLDGRSLLVSRTCGAIAMLSLAPALGAVGGSRGAAWGLAAGAALTLGATVVVAQHLRKHYAIEGWGRKALGRLALRAFQAMPAAVYQRLRWNRLARKVGRGALDALLPSRGLQVSEVIRGRLRGIVLELDPRTHKEMLVGRYEPKVENALARLLRRGDWAWDIGANLGYTSLLMASMVGVDGRVLAVEPDPDVLVTLQRNARQADGRIEVCGVAAGRQAGEAWFRRGLNSSTGRLSEGVADFKVRVVPLDMLVSAYGIPSLVKVDVEGAELEVLEGAQQLLGAAGTVWVIEVHSAILERDCLALLGDHGFTCERLEPVGSRSSHIVALPPLWGSDQTDMPGPNCD